MRYILLLRGVNVGGKNKVSMSELKNRLQESGFEAVESYINSGNLFFDTDKSMADCKHLVDDILKAYDFDISYALLDREDYGRLRKNLPKWWFDDLARKDVLFLTDDADYHTVKESIETMNLYNECVHFGEKAIFWGKTDEKEFLKTAYHKELMKHKFYRRLTIRNGKTFDKIQDFLHSTDEQS